MNSIQIRDLPVPKGCEEGFKRITSVMEHLKECRKCREDGVIFVVGLIKPYPVIVTTLRMMGFDLKKKCVEFIEGKIL